MSMPANYHRSIPEWLNGDNRIEGVEIDPMADRPSDPVQTPPVGVRRVEESRYALRDPAPLFLG